MPPLALYSTPTVQFPIQSSQQPTRIQVTAPRPGALAAPTFVPPPEIYPTPIVHSPTLLDNIG